MNDISVTGLAAENIRAVADFGVSVEGATLPIMSGDMLRVIAGYTNVQFVSGNGGKLFMIGWRDTEFDVYALAGYEPVKL